MSDAKAALTKAEQDLQTDQATLKKLEESLNGLNNAKNDIQKAQEALDKAKEQNAEDKAALQQAEADLEKAEEELQNAESSTTRVTTTKKLGNHIILNGSHVVTPSVTSASMTNVSQPVSATATTTAKVNNSATNITTTNSTMPTRAEYRASLPTTGDDNNKAAGVFGAVMVVISGAYLLTLVWHVRNVKTNR